MTSILMGRDSPRIEELGARRGRKLDMIFYPAVLVAGMVVVLCTPLRARAEVAPPCSPLNRSNLVPCALSASLLVRAEAEELEAARGREKAVSSVLPSNPVLELSAARRTSGSTEANNWYVTLNQEVEVAGQRGVRRDGASAALRAQSQRIVVSRRVTAARAWVTFFEALAASEEQRLTARLTEITRRVSTVAQARADLGLAAPVEADVAMATTMATAAAQLRAVRQVKQTEAALAALLGLDPLEAAVQVEGELNPIAGVSEALKTYTAASLARRPEVLAAEAEAQAQERRADSFRRSRIPNPTLSVFAQNDGLNERVFGAGLSFPIPLPGNIGQTFIGEIAEAEALARRARTGRQQTERDIRLDIATAAQMFESTTQEVELFAKERLDRAEAGLESLAGEVEAGHLAVRDAVVSQQALIDLLNAHIEARREWCVASVDLARALGLPLEESAQ